MAYRSRILIADEHRLIAEACESLLEAEFDVVGVVSDGRALLHCAAEMNPDVVILDIAMPQLNGLDAGEYLKQKNRAIKLVFLTANTSPAVAAEAFRRGASGYVLKNSSADELRVTIRRVLRGESHLSSLINRDAVDYFLRTGSTLSEKKRISCRQAEVVQLLAEGKPMKEVAHILDVKPGTVAFHKYRAMETLGLRTNAELIG